MRPVEDLPEFVLSILEFLAELFLEGDALSQRTKAWVKTVIICVLGALVEALLIACAVHVWRNGNAAGRFMITAIAVAWAVFVTVGTVRGHRRQWTTK